MNKDEIQGAARYYNGKLEKTAGDVVDSRDWQVDGVVNQIAGNAQNAFGRARSVVGDMVDSAPAIAGEARDRLGDASRRAADRIGRVSQDATAALRRTPPIAWAVGAAVAGYALGWLLHGRRV
ncbi:CsbD family protein [Sphingomonas sp. 1P06PA]|uniref:CsbD family protein n=1 Tax=Sphingomonas sp. 1P06PA TaxID=554121 RepID=UPI0039A4CEA5